VRLHQTKRASLFWAFFWTAAIAWHASQVAVGTLYTHNAFTIVVSGILLPISILLCYLNWKDVNEHRRAQGNRQRAGTGAVGGALAHSPSYARIRALSAGAHALGPRPGMSLPERTDTQPYLGWKNARLIWIPGDHYLFGGVSIGKATQYGLRARARCLSDGPASSQPDHQAPAESCSCGFYAHARQPQSESYAAEYVALEVELGGKVIVCTDGYRAEWQRVLNIVVPQVCYACEQKATSLAIATDDGGPHQALPWCEEHLESMHVLTFASVASDLGVGISWRPWK